MTFYHMRSTGVMVLSLMKAIGLNVPLDTETGQTQKAL